MRFFLLIRTWSIGMLLAAAAAFCGYQAVEVWSEQPAVKEAVQKPAKPQADRGVADRRSQPVKNFEVIAGKDLFSSDRRERLPQKAPAPAPAPVKAAPLLDKRYMLFGIVIDGGEKRALVTNLAKKKPEEKATIWVKVGDKMGNLNVSEIQPDQIILANGNQTFTLRLSDQNQPQKRAGARKKKKPVEPRTTVIKTQKDTKPAASESTDKQPAAKASKASS